jgi:hypothetical protein
MPFGRSVVGQGFGVRKKADSACDRFGQSADGRQTALQQPVALEVVVCGVAWLAASTATPSLERRAAGSARIM